MNCNSSLSSIVVLACVGSYTDIIAYFSSFIFATKLTILSDTCMSLLISVSFLCVNPKP